MISKKQISLSFQDDFLFPLLILNLIRLKIKFEKMLFSGIFRILHLLSSATVVASIIITLLADFSEMDIADHKSFKKSVHFAGLAMIFSGIALIFSMGFKASSPEVNLYKQSVSVKFILSISVTPFAVYFFSLFYFPVRIVC